jgi:hypothetical protein
VSRGLSARRNVITRAGWIFCLLSLASGLNGLSSQMPSPGLTRAHASRFAALALRCVRTEYPNKLDHVMNDPGEVLSPAALHPAFYGCFDWHSSVHGHWMLVRLLRTFPDLTEAPAIRAALNRSFTPANIAAEVAYLDRPNRQSFERTYGWAWLLKLQQEVSGWRDPDGERWAHTLQPLATAFSSRLQQFLPKQDYPIRTGVHPNTAFALAFAWDFSHASGDKRLEQLVAERSRSYFLADTRYPAEWEPGGEDFFSPALMEADLMRRVLPGPEFARWFHRLLPAIEAGRPSSLLNPARVTDRTDPKLVHLDGLNLSRAWCMHHIATALGPGSAAGKILAEAAVRHEAAGLAHVASGDYAGEHWLASFAVYLLSERPTR